MLYAMASNVLTKKSGIQVIQVKFVISTYMYYYRYCVWAKGFQTGRAGQIVN